MRSIASFCVSGPLGTIAIVAPASAEESAAELLAGGEKPILVEDALEIPHGGAVDPHVDVAPLAHALHEAAVFVADVEAAGEGCRAVDDDDLPVVPEVHGLQEDRPHRQEGPRAHARFLPRAEEAPVHEAHLDAAHRGRDKAVLEPLAGRVVADQVILRVDVVARAVDGGAECVVGVVAAEERRDAVLRRGAAVREVRAHSEELELHRGRRVLEREGHEIGLRRVVGGADDAGAGLGEIGADDRVVLALSLRRHTHSLAPERDEEERADGRQEHEREDPRDRARGLLAPQEDERDERERDDLEEEADPQVQRVEVHG
jgi:hypothetical protein